MRLLGIALSALLLAGCAVVPLAPVMYVPEPAVKVRVHYGRPGYTHTGYHYGNHHRHR
ncbi:MAG: hypothetical protein ACRELS_10055 [Candidatus Rokuibacteriota bacterium]